MKTLKILVVEDNINSTYLLETLLTGSGYKVLTSGNGAEALKKLRESHIDLIISDILMPKMDGFRLCRECKKDEKLKHIPFIFYTATYTGKADEKFALSLGAEKFIIKPQEPDVLLKVIDDTLEEKKKKKPGTASKKTIKEEGPYLAEYNKRVVKKLEDKVKKLNKEIDRRKKVEGRLFQRIKELDCLCSITNLAIEPDVPVEKIFKETIKYLSEGMLNPEAICSRIIYHDKEFKTGNFRKTRWRKSSDIKVGGKKAGVIEAYSLGEKIKSRFSKEEKKMIDGISKIIGIHIEGKIAEEKLEESYRILKKVLNGIINTLISIVEAKDPYTSGHQKRVALLATAISEKLGICREKIEAINTAALIHDIGKVTIPASILSKPGKLTDIEYAMIKAHSQTGYEMLKEVEFTYPIARIVAQHHERLDGSGYPLGLKGKDIIMEARILGVADVIEAMISHRPYRPALGVDKMMEEIDKGRNKLYDPKVVDACMKIFHEKKIKIDFSKI